MTLRAFLLGGLVALLLAALTPWNDWAAKNTLIHGNYLPPIIVVGLALFAGVVNPRLGSRRFTPAELATMLALVLVVGSVASIGIMRHFTPVMVDPVVSMDKAGALERWGREIKADEREALIAEREEVARRAITHHDRDGDGRLDADERRGLGLVLANGDADSDGFIDARELRRGLIGDPVATAPAIPAAILAERDPAWPTKANSLDREVVTNAYLYGRSGREIHAGSTFRLSNGSDERALVHLDGHAALEALAAGRSVADPSSDPRAAQLLGLPKGASFPIDGTTWTLDGYGDPPIPWSSWFRALLGWSPALLAVIAGSLALSALVHHQWARNERLAMPIAKVFGALIGSEGNADDQGRPRVLLAKALWISAGIVVAIHTLRLANHLGWVPFTFPMEYDLSKFRGVLRSVDLAPSNTDIFMPRIWFTVVALSFLMTTEASGSMWGSFIVVNLFAGLAIASGATVAGSDLDKIGVGASWALCALVLWVGRRHYLACLAAACGRQRDAEASAAAPWIWVLAGSCAMLAVFLTSLGTPLGIACCATLITFASIVAIARVIAETGTPYASFGTPGRVGGIFMDILGPGLGAAALMPLMLVGHVVGLGDRERLMPHALHAIEVQAGSGRSGGRRLILGLGLVCLGSAFLAFISQVLIGYQFGGQTLDSFSRACWNWFVWRGEGNIDVPAVAAQTARETWVFYALGAGAFAALGLARLQFARFPLHPIGLIIVGGWVTKWCWASFFLGWLIKILVMRYGSQRLYRQLFPVAMGLILGEAIVVALRMIIGLTLALTGNEPIDLDVLPS